MSVSCVVRAFISFKHYLYYPSSNNDRPETNIRCQLLEGAFVKN